jgi:hypothetical protein
MANAASLRESKKQKKASCFADERACESSFGQRKRRPSYEGFRLAGMPCFSQIVQKASARALSLGYGTITCSVDLQLLPRIGARMARTYVVPHAFVLVLRAQADAWWCERPVS